MVVADDVDGDDRVGRVFQDARELAFGRFLERRVDLLDRHLALEFDRQVDHGSVGRGNARGEAIELARQFRQDQSDRAGGAGGGGDHGHGSGARTTEILVGKVEDALVVGIGVNGVHEAALDAELLQEHLGHGSQAVRRAGSVRDDVVLVLVVQAVVDAHHDGDVLALRGAGDDDLLRAGLDVLGGQLAGLEDAGGLDDDVDAELAPGQVLGLAVGEDLDRMAVGDEAVFGQFDGIEEAAVHGIVFQQVSKGFQVTGVVDRHNVDCRVLDHGAERQTSDTTESVDANFDCHCEIPFENSFEPNRVSVAYATPAEENIRRAVDYADELPPRTAPRRLHAPHISRVFAARPREPSARCAARGGRPQTSKAAAWQARRALSRWRRGCARAA